MINRAKTGGPGRCSPARDAQERGHGRRHHGHRHGHRGRHGSRPFDYGELRLVVLSMLAERPSHGYELMRAIEERMGGSYAPSPGVIYPTLAWLEEMGYAAVDADPDDGGRKRYRVTVEGQAFLAANRAAIEDLTSRLAPASGRGRTGIPDPVYRGMENVRLALRLRFRRGGLDEAAVAGIAAALDEAARAIEGS